MLVKMTAISYECDDAHLHVLNGIWSSVEPEPHETVLVDDENRPGEYFRAVAEVILNLN
jgi:hypothetical protein